MKLVKDRSPGQKHRRFGCSVVDHTQGPRTEVKKSRRLGMLWALEKRRGGTGKAGNLELIWGVVSLEIGVWGNFHIHFCDSHIPSTFHL